MKLRSQKLDVLVDVKNRTRGDDVLTICTIVWRDNNDILIRCIGTSIVI